MLVTRTDPMTGQDNTYDLDITQEQFDRWQDGELIQNVMPNLTADEREFLISGIAIGTYEDYFEDEEYF